MGLLLCWGRGRGLDSLDGGGVGLANDVGPAVDGLEVVVFALGERAAVEDRDAVAYPSGWRGGMVSARRGNKYNLSPLSTHDHGKQRTLLLVVDEDLGGAVHGLEELGVLKLAVDGDGDGLAHDAGLGDEAGEDVGHGGEEGGRVCVAGCAQREVV